MKHKNILFFILILAAFSITACGNGKTGTLSASDAEKAAVSADEKASASEALSSSEASPSSAAGDSKKGSQENALQETQVKAADIKVTKHEQEGKAMVTAKGMTISVPTTFTGLEKDGFEFQGAEDTLAPGDSGSCRVGYKGSFNNIKLKVKNMTEDTMMVKDCTIKGVEVASQTADPDLTLYGVPMGATRTNVLSVYGEPFNETDPDENKISVVTYQFGSDINSSRVVFLYFKEGKVIDATYDDFSLIGK